MHREITHGDTAFGHESNLPLYFMTGLLGVLIGLDLLAPLAGWPTGLGSYRFALIAAVLGGARILYTSLQALLEGRIGADLALAIACIAAILINEPLVAAEVVFIGMVGECLEAFTFARTQSAVRKIVEVFPYRCWRLENGQEVRVLTSQLQVGDQVVVKPGAKIPVDGVVRDGRSAVDTSALTGESLPQDKEPGDEVLAGSVNQFGALVIEARKVAEQTVAGRVIELTGRALKDKADIERTADRLARYFLPAVLGLAALTFLAALLYHGTGIFKPSDAPRLGLRSALTLSMYPTLSVLVVACPCALILATPAAIIAALGRLAGTGVLIKGGSAIERLANVTAFAFDKTGTITEGRLELAAIEPLGDISAEELLRLAASAEQKSEHPLARLILQAAESRSLDLEAIQEFQAYPGAGITAQIGGSKVLVGTPRLLEEKALTLSPDVLRLLEQLDAHGQTALLVARDDIILGVLGARDRLRPEATGVLHELRELGIDPIVLLTGDRVAAAKALAADLPFSEIHAELLPEQKATLIERLRGEEVDPVGKRQAPKVAMVGDGINDALALARADVGLAIGGTGTDIAAEAGDVVFMGDPLRPLPLLVRLSRETVRIIRQNILWFAFGVNAVGIVLTAWLWPLFAPAGWYEQSPIAAVIYHQIGSLAVLLNSMRLLWFERAATSPLWVRFKAWLRQTDLWLEKHLDAGEMLHWGGHHRRGVVVALALVLVAVYASTGLTVLAPDELGVVRRFGRPVDDLGPGWHLRWPWPIEDVVRVSQKVRTVEIGFREQPQKTRSAAAFTWSSTHAENRIPDEALMITGDGDLVDILVAIRYRVGRPRAYLFEVKDAPEILRASGEAVLRTMVAGRKFLDLLTIERGPFQEEFLRRLEERLDAFGYTGLGIELDGVSLLDLHPPTEVVGAYYEVAKAMEGRGQKINEAQEKATRKLKTTEAEKERILSQARAASLEKVRKAEGELARFTARSRGRKELTFFQEVQLGLETTHALLSGVSPGEIEQELDRRRQRIIGVQAALSDFRIYWDTLAGALAGRDLILIDADKVKGQRNLFLVEPDQFRPGLPMFLPGDRPKGPALRPGEEP